MPPEILALLKRDVSGHVAGMEHLARQIPSQEKLEEWLEESIRTYHDAGYAFLSLAGLQAGLVLQGRHLERGLMLLGNDEDYGSFFAWRSTGDVSAHVLWALGNTFLFPKSRAALMWMVVLWCRAHGNQPVPPVVYSTARELFRSFSHCPHTLGSLLCIASVTQEPGLVAVAKVKAEKTQQPDFAKWRELAEQTATVLIKRWEGSPLAGLPPAPPQPSRVLASGSTMRRAVERLGRNEPCHCGSGRKYKHCCIQKDEERLHDSSTVAGVTRNEMEQALELYLSPKDFDRLAPHVLLRLDPGRMRADLIPYLLIALAFAGLFERFIEVLPPPPWSKRVLTAWSTALFFAARSHKTEAVKRLAALRPHEEMNLGENCQFLAALELAEGEAETQLRLIKNKTLEILRGETKEQQLVDFAIAMLCSRHCELGILIARGMLPLLSASPAASLLDELMKARDRLNLPPDDPFSDIVDKMLLKNRNEEGDGKDVAALRKAQRNLEKKAEEVRALKESLAQVQRDLELKERKEKRAAAESAAQPTAEEKKEAADLRTRVDELKSTLKATHIERNEFRRDLEQAQSELEQLRAAQPKSGEPEGAGDEESLLLPPEPAISQPVRLLEFPKKFEEVLHAVPKHIARNTMVTLGQIAGGEGSAFAGAVRLKACPDITRQRIGSDYRLLFRLLPDRVQVVALINRRDLDRTIKSLT